MELMCQNMEEPSTENCRREHDSLVQFKSDQTRQLSANVKMFFGWTSFTSYKLQVTSYKLQVTEDLDVFKSEVMKDAHIKCQMSTLIWDWWCLTALFCNLMCLSTKRSPNPCLEAICNMHACSKLPQTECNNIWHKLSRKQLRKNDTKLITSKSVMINKGIRSKNCCKSILFLIYERLARRRQLGRT